MKAFLILLISLFYLGQLVQANTIVVVNTNDSGVGSLRAAITSSNNYDTIRFDPNLIAAGNDTIKFASVININKNLVIIGLYNSSSALYLSGENSVQLFNADLTSVNNPVPKNVTLDSLRFIKGSSSGGGAVRFKGLNLFVRNSIFSNNTATYGGAIISIETFGIVTINNCEFNANTATSSSGGAVFVNGQVFLLNSEFTNNSGLKGGAVYSERKMTIDNSTFINNTATEWGGAVSLSSNTSTTYFPFAVTNSIFENNTSNYGGAIYAYFYNAKVDLLIDNTTFDNNHSVWAGGAVCASSTWYKATIDINDSRIINNTSDDVGAGIHCSAVYENATILADSCLVENNAALGFGGGISAYTSTGTSSAADTAIVRLTHSTVINNSASNGGGISCRGTGGAFGATYLLVENSIVSNNTATLDGGGIYNLASASNDLGAYPGKARTFINYSTIDNNDAGDDGGGLYSNSFSAASNGPSQSLVFVNQSTFFNNSAFDDGGAIGNYSRNNGFLSFNSGVSVTINNATIYNNSAADGGAVSSKFSSYWQSSNPGAMAVQVGSSIVAMNGGNDFFAADSIVSLGYNLFSATAIPGSVALDQMLIDSAALALGPLQLNGGVTPTLLPSFTSVAINAGNPLDLTNAQNVPINGIRDVGAAESVAVMNLAVCDSLVSPSGNTTYYSSGFYTDTVIASGVDSLIFINLSVNTSYSSLFDTICAGDTYISPSGSSYFTSLNFTDTIPNYLSCDSIISISLTVLNPSYASLDTVACGTYISPSGTLYLLPGVYTDIIPTVAGCDSIISINLSFGNSSSSISEIACSQYVAPSGNSYTSSGVYTDTIPNALGCDSIITVNVTILNPASGTDVQTACESFTWIDGNTYTASNNSAIYTYAGAAANGCDSIVTLDLTILNSSAGTDVHTACESFTWIDGNTYTASNNSAIYTYAGAAANGCDSIVTLDLTILNSSAGTDVQTACESFTWIDGNTYTASNNTAQWILTNAAGCDSVVTLDVTIFYSSTGTDVQTACGQFTWIDGNTYTASNNTAQWILTNAAGCDSIVSLNLVITTVEITTTQLDELTIQADATGANYQWLDCSNNFAILPGETNQTFVASDNGNYAIEVSQNGCIDTSACVSITQVSLDENDLVQYILLYPNPTTGAFTLKLHSSEMSIQQVMVKNAFGQEISVYAYSQANELELEIEGEPGVYFIEIETSNGTRSEHRIVKL